MYPSASIAQVWCGDDAERLGCLWRSVVTPYVVPALIAYPERQMRQIWTIRVHLCSVSQSGCHINCAAATVDDLLVHLCCLLTLPRFLRRWGCRPIDFKKLVNLWISLNLRARNGRALCPVQIGTVAANVALVAAIAIAVGYRHNSSLRSPALVGGYFLK